MLSPRLPTPANRRLHFALIAGAVVFIAARPPRMLKD